MHKSTTSNMWTVCTNALASIIFNTWDEAVDVDTDTESKARINGVTA